MFARYGTQRTCRANLRRSWSCLALAAFSMLAPPRAGAAEEGQPGATSTATVGIRFEVRSHIHFRQVSLSSHRDDLLPSSSGHRFCLNSTNVAAFTLNTLAKSDTLSRLNPVALRAAAVSDPCDGPSSLYVVDGIEGAANSPFLLIVSPL